MERVGTGVMKQIITGTVRSVPFSHFSELGIFVL